MWPCSVTAARQRVKCRAVRSQWRERGHAAALPSNIAGWGMLQLTDVARCRVEPTYPPVCASIASRCCCAASSTAGSTALAARSAPGSRRATRWRAPAARAAALFPAARACCTRCRQQQRHRGIRQAVRIVMRIGRLRGRAGRPGPMLPPTPAGTDDGSQALAAGRTTGAGHRRQRRHRPRDRARTARLRRRRAARRARRHRAGPHARRTAEEFPDARRARARRRRRRRGAAPRDARLGRGPRRGPQHPGQQRRRQPQQPSDRLHRGRVARDLRGQPVLPRSSCRATRIRC